MKYGVGEVIQLTRMILFASNDYILPGSYIKIISTPDEHCSSYRILMPNGVVRLVSEDMIVGVSE